MTRADAERILREAGQSDDRDIDLARTALAFAARERDEAGAPRYRLHLAELARDLAERAGGHDLDAAAQLDALRRVLVDIHGYEGDRTTYDDIKNADLAHVIDRKRGLPVALAILWLHAARSAGWSMHGINFPGHFLLQLDAQGERVFVDPFNGGRLLSTGELDRMLKALLGSDAELAAEHTAALSNRGILLRLQNNIKVRLLKANDATAAVTVLEGMLMLAPTKAGLWREAGLIHSQMENLRAAQICLGNAVELAENPAARQRIAAELAAIRGKLN
jgi:regulator of sirC expression with transglutaminase-like and TPR domain